MRPTFSTSFSSASSSFRRKSKRVVLHQLGRVEQRACRRRLLLPADEVGFRHPLGLDDLVQQLAHVAGQDDVLDADLADLGTEGSRTLGNERAHLQVDGVARSEDLIQRAGRHRLAYGELDEAVERAGHVGRRQRRLLRVGDLGEGGQRHADADAVLGQDLLRRHLERLRSQIDLGDLHRAADLPEGVPARRQPLFQLAVDHEQARLVRLDHRERDDARAARRVELVEVALGNAQLALGVDQFDIDAGQRSPVGARGVRRDEMLGLAVERDDGDLGRADLHDLEILFGYRPVRPVQ